MTNVPPPQVNVIETQRLWYHRESSSTDDVKSSNMSAEIVGDLPETEVRPGVARVVAYFTRKIAEGHRRSRKQARRNRRAQKATARDSSRNGDPSQGRLKNAGDILEEIKAEIKSMEFSKIPGNFLNAARSEMRSAKTLARRRIKKHKDGRYTLPQYGITGYPKVVYLLKTLPHNNLAYHTVVLIVIMILSFFRFCVAWLIFVYIVIEGYQIYMMSRKLVCEKLNLPNHDPVDPAFILNPEIETVGWMNKLIKGLWTTCLRSFAKRDLKRAINRILRKKSKKFKENKYLKYLKPKILELDIGEYSPQITGLKTYASEINLLNSSDESLTLDIGVIMHLKPRILVSINNNFSFGIHEVQLDAPMRFRFVPLLRDKTFFGQVQFSFLLPPVLNFQFSGVFGCLCLSMIKPIILNSIQEAFKYVLHPHKLVIPNPLVDDFRNHTLAISKPIGLLRVNLKEGAHLKPGDMPVCCVFIAQSDPYVVLRLGPKAEKTPVIKKNLMPNWNHICEFPVTDLDVKYRELKLNVLDFDWGFWTDDDPLGFTTISVAEIVRRKQVDEWYRLGEGGDGTLHLLVQYVPLEVDKIPENPRIPADPRVSQGVLVILLYEVQMSHLCKPMIVFEVSGRPPSTSSPGQLSENWEFAEEFIFPIHNVKTDKMTISLVDYEAKVTVRAVTGRMCQSVKDFIASSDDPQSIKEYQRERHYLLGEKTMDLEGHDGFTGFKQQINLESGEGGIYHVILIGRLHYLRNQEYKVRSVSSDCPRAQKGHGDGEK